MTALPPSLAGAVQFSFTDSDAGFATRVSGEVGGAAEAVGVVLTSLDAALDPTALIAFTVMKILTPLVSPVIR